MKKLTLLLLFVVATGWAQITQADVEAVFPFVGQHPQAGQLVKEKPDLSGLDAAMAKRAGTFLNPMSVRLTDFDFGAVILNATPSPDPTSRYTQVHVIFKHKGTKQYHVGELKLFAINDYWVILGELSGISRKEE